MNYSTILCDGFLYCKVKQDYHNLGCKFDVPYEGEDAIVIEISGLYDKRREWMFKTDIGQCGSSIITDSNTWPMLYAFTYDGKNKVCRGKGVVSQGQNNRYWEEKYYVRISGIGHDVEMERDLSESQGPHFGLSPNKEKVSLDFSSSLYGGLHTHRVTLELVKYTRCLELPTSFRDPRGTVWKRIERRTSCNDLSEFSGLYEAEVYNFDIRGINFTYILGGKNSVCQYGTSNLVVYQNCIDTNSKFVLPSVRPRGEYGKSSVLAYLSTFFIYGLVTILVVLLVVKKKANRANKKI